MPALKKVGCVGVALAATALMLVAPSTASFAAPRSSSGALLGPGPIPGSYGTLPPSSGTPAATQSTMVENLEPGAGPTWIFPVIPATVYTTDVVSLTEFSWRPLWWAPDGTDIYIDWSQSMASAPVFTDNNKTATINLKPGWTWSDGQPVTATDVLFDYWLTEAAATLSPTNIPDFTPGLFPTDVTSITAPNASTVVVHFNATHNQDFAFLFELDQLSPLPAHAWSETSASGPIIPYCATGVTANCFNNLKTAEKIYNFLANSNPKLGPLGQAEDLKTYATNPLWQVVDGPFKISAFDPATGGYSMVANTSYSGPVKPKIPGIQFEYFTSESAEVDALLTGSLDVATVPHAYGQEIPKIEAEGYTIFGYPEDEFGIVVFNFKDPTGSWGKIVSQLYIRQAMQHLVDQAGIIKSRGIWDGEAVPDYGTLPSAPPTPFTPTNATTNPYPFSISTAKQLLTSHGWKVVPNGTSTCQDPGTGPSQCGAGIPAGAPLASNYYYANNTPISANIAEALSADFTQVGINLKLIPKTFNYIVANLNDPAAPANEKLWGMENFGYYTQGLYPTSNGVFNTGAGSNLGDFSDPIVDQAINGSVFSLNNRAIEHEIYVETQQLPGLFLPNEVRLLAVKKGIVGPAFSFENQPDFYTWNPEYWYFAK